LGPLVATVFAAFAFWPQAGVLGQDLYFTNSVDLDPAAAATLDPWCGSRTYDTHTGDDVVIRSFREAAIGVPVFSVTDGTVSEVQDGFYDWSYGTHTQPFDNHVDVTAPDGRIFVYGHLRHGLKLKRGVKVRTGQQLGWSGSSGNSSWPHLHFTEIVDGQIREAFAGACRAGTSDFAVQLHPFRDAPYVRNLVVSPKPFRGEAQLPWDQAVRTGTFVAGTRDVWFRVELGEWAGGAELVQLVRPDGSVALEDASPAGVFDGVGAGYHGQAAYDFHERVRFDALGTWRLRYSLDGKLLADAPLLVVAGAQQARNRAPNPVSVTLSVQGGARCVVSTSLVTRDPDYDLVRYRYRWSAGGKVLRALTSAALSDVLVRDAAKPGQTLRCDVTPTDGKRPAKTASAAAQVPGAR
jgi:Peptidase family M23